MKKRFAVGKGQKRTFSRTASQTHRFNTGSSGALVMRGGIRL